MPSRFSYFRVSYDILTPRSAYQQRVGLWVLRVRVIVEAFAALPAQHPGEHHPLHQRRGGEALFAKLVEHNLGDIESGIEAHKIVQRERAHGMVAPELHSVVDILDGARALFERANGVQKV